LPAISVIIPAYERPTLVERAVQSVLDQTGVDVEVVVIDDGSPSDLIGQCRVLGHPKVRYIRQENQGTGAARNRGLAAAQGDFVAFLDSDDVLLPGSLASLRAQFDGRRQTDAVHGWAVFRDQDQREVQLLRPRLRGRSLAHLLFRNVLSMGTVLLRYGCWEPIGGFDPGLPVFEDWDFWLRLSLHCDFDFVPKVVASISIQDVRRNTSLPSARVGATVRSIYAKLLEDPVAGPQVRKRVRHLRANEHVMTGHHKRLYDQDQRSARREFLRAIRVAPDMPAAYVGLAEAMLGQTVIHQLRLARSALFRWRAR
jgi:glycosyltransferase involved in cell wall biosynthesis